LRENELLENERERTAEKWWKGRTIADREREVKHCKQREREKCWKV